MAALTTGQVKLGLTTDQIAALTTARRGMPCVQPTLPR